MILLPFLANVKLFVSKVLAKSKTLIWSPTNGEPGNVIVTAPPEVSTNTLSLAAIAYGLSVLSILPQGLPPPKPVHCVPL